MRRHENEIAIKCPTKKEAEELFEFLAANGAKWNNRETLNSRNTSWRNYEENTAYFLDHRNYLLFGAEVDIDKTMEVFDSVSDFIAAYQDCQPISLDIGDLL